MSSIRSTRLLRLREVLSKTGLARSSLYALMSHGGFPEQVPLSPIGAGRAVAWVESEIDTWIADQIARRDAIQKTKK